MATLKGVRSRLRFARRQDSKLGKIKLIIVYSKNIAAFLNKHNLKHTYHHYRIDYSGYTNDGVKFTKR